MEEFNLAGHERAKQIMYYFNCDKHLRQLIPSGGSSQLDFSRQQAADFVFLPHNLNLIVLVDKRSNYPPTANRQLLTANCYLPFTIYNLQFTTMQPRTKRQREILDYLTYFIEEHGYEPSYQQIARRFRIASKSAIANHIAALEKQGLILRHRENGSFNLQLRPQNSSAASVCEIEWLDISPAQKKIEEEWEESPLFVAKFLLGYFQPERIRAFRVPNDSMIEDHICEGDIILVEERPFARDGDCVVALIEREKVVLNRFYRDGAKIELRPASPDFSILRLPADKVSVKGIFRALLRPLS